ncbi:MAG: glycosyltransferase family 39 protein [Acidobacteriota bacterium]|nr:glycosyltransferase family 39 protein [Blastocatellia bacterium]MDW8412707.1 glycosyltransferase family 39 protein [Acidobacteriota bacterium]
MPKSETARSCAFLLLLIGAWVTFCISTFIWTKQNLTPPRWDPADHLRYGLEYMTALRSLDLAAVFEQFFYTTRYYPPFYHLTIGIVASLTGASSYAGITVNLLLLAAMMYSLYSLGKKLYSEEAGLIAAIAAPSYHINAALMHETFVDFALVCLVAVGLYALELTEGFKNRNASIFYGFTLALGMLCKQTYCVFLLLPTLATAIGALRNSKTRSNLGLAISVAAVLTATWYLPHLQEIIEIYKINRKAAISENDPPVLSYFSNMTYIHVLASDHLQLPATALFVLSTILSFIFCARRSSSLYLCILGGLTFFTLMANKDSRYTAPILPAIALLSSWWIAKIDSEILKILLIMLICLLAGSSFAQAQWPDSSPPLQLKSTYYSWNIKAGNYLGYDGRPGKEGWAIREIIASILRNPASDRKFVRVGFVCNEPTFNPSAFALYAQYQNLQNIRPKLMTEWLVTKEAQRKIRACDYIVLREGVEYDNPIEKSYAEEVSSITNLSKIAEFDLPKGKAVVYQQPVEIERWKIGFVEQ